MAGRLQPEPEEGVWEQKCVTAAAWGRSTAGEEVRALHGQTALGIALWARTDGPSGSRILWELSLRDPCTQLWMRAAVPTLFGTRDQFRGRQFFPGLEVGEEG